MSSEIDVINHLLQVEKNASLLIDQALEGSALKISEAKSNANLLVQEKSLEIQNELEHKFEQQIQTAQEEHKKIILQYQDELSKKVQNKDKFNLVLQDLLTH